MSERIIRKRLFWTNHIGCGPRQVRRKIQKENYKSLKRVQSNFLSLRLSSTIKYLQEYDQKHPNLISRNKHNKEIVMQSNLYNVSESEYIKNGSSMKNMLLSGEDNYLLPKDLNILNIENETEGGIFDNNESVIFDELEFNYRYSDYEDSNYSDEDSGYFDDDSIIVKHGIKSVSSEDNSSKAVDSITSISNGLRDLISRWAVICNISQISISKLLHSIREEIPLLSLPLDPRTLLKTPKHTEIFNIEGGQYCHFGTRICIEKIIKKRLFYAIDHKNIDLIINIDGAPLGKKSERNLWPILCSERLINDVYIVGIYCGESKPKDANEFMDKFVDETIELVNDGISIKNIHYNVKINAIVCDAPAKFYILGVKYHSGYHSCTKCMVEGQMYKNVCFPGQIGTLRTDEQFKGNCYQHDYQVRETILNKIPNLGLVTNVPLDPMHLVHLGCTRKLLLLWLFASTGSKLPQKSIDGISNALHSLKSHIPYDFARKPRPLKYVKFYKATEFRLFLLYTGVIALKEYLSYDVYINFVALHIAITILTSPFLCKMENYIKFAENLIETFVQHFQDIYGPNYVSYNVHSLLHLVNDVRKYGNLEKFSAFRFENFIVRIKNLIRKGNQPLQQLMRRCTEIEKIQEVPINIINSQVLQLLQEHCQGPLTFVLKEGIQYKIAKFHSFKINCTDDKNNCILIDRKYIVKVLNIIQCKNEEIYVIGHKLKIIGDLFDCPCASSDIGINIISNNINNDNLESWNVKRVTAKLMKLPYKDNFASFPILHTCSA